MSSKFSVEIETGNAAFDNNPSWEIARILSTLADRLRRVPVENGTLRDINGNTVGTFWTTRD